MGAASAAKDFACLKRHGALLAAASVAEEDTALILYTSGTTGRPKGAMLTHFNIVHSVMHFEACMRPTHADRSALVVPASHVTGTLAMIAAMLRVGGALGRAASPRHPAPPRADLLARLDLVVAHHRGPAVDLAGDKPAQFIRGGGADHHTHLHHSFLHCRNPECLGEFGIHA